MSKNSYKNNEAKDDIARRALAEAKERKEKTGRNISKNTTIIIPAHHIPSFKPAKVFKEEVKNNVK